VASALFRRIYGQSQDKGWLARAYAALEKEYAFWMALRCAPNGLNRYGQHATPRMVDAFEDNFEVGERLHLFPVEHSARLRALAHAMAEAESGWDFTPRFEQRCEEFTPIDLNSLLYLLETNAAWFCGELGTGQAGLWQERAGRRQELINRFCWNEARGFYYDYDFAGQRQSPVESAAAYFALWAGAASAGQAARLVENLPLLERAYGVVTCAPGARRGEQKSQRPQRPFLLLSVVPGIEQAGQGREPGLQSLALGPIPVDIDADQEGVGEGGFDIPIVGHDHLRIEVE
jgi:alpha,alpha-trehalase